MLTNAKGHAIWHADTISHWYYQTVPRAPNQSSQDDILLDNGRHLLYALPDDRSSSVLRKYWLHAKIRCMERAHGMVNGVLVVPADGMRNSMPHRAHLRSTWSDIATEITKATGNEHDEHAI
jgi:hypothetical protein